MRDLHQTRRSAADVAADVQTTRSAHKPAIDAFHRLWYGARTTWGMTTFEGVPILKNPLDLWVYQDILWHLRPTLVVETGTALGGSALWFARQFDRLGVGHVISIDIEPHTDLPQHDRIFYVNGSSVDPVVVDAVRHVAATHPRVMVVLDSDHGAAHVTAELDAYAPMVSVDQFLVVEDTNINGRPVDMDWHGGPGPGPAVDAWLPSHPQFVRDVTAERYLLTCHPGGWLRRVLPDAE